MIDFSEITGIYRRMLSGSKSRYSNNYPFRCPIFNAKVVVDNEFVWGGDLDFFLDYENLLKLKDHCESFYVFRESALRSNRNNKPFSTMHYEMKYENGEIHLANNYILSEDEKYCVSEYYLNNSFSYNSNQLGKSFFSDREFLEIEVPLLNKEFKFVDFKDYLSEFLIENFDLIRNDKITFYNEKIEKHSIMNMFDYSSERFDRFEVMNQVHSFVEENNSPKALLEFLYSKKDESKQWRDVLKLFLNVDSYFLVGFDYGKELYFNQLNYFKRNNHIELSQKDLRELESISKKYNLKNSKKLCTLLSNKSKRDWFEIRSVNKKERINKLLNKSYEELFNLSVKDKESEKGSYILSDLSEYYTSLSNSIFSFYIYGEDNRKIRIPLTKGIII